MSGFFALLSVLIRFFCFLILALLSFSLALALSLADSLDARLLRKRAISFPVFPIRYEK